MRQFLIRAVPVLVSSVLIVSAARAEPLPLERDELTLGFIKLTDMAPLAIAYEKHFFEDEGLYVRLEAQANWKVLLNRVISGELDGAQMLAGQPLAATLGYGTKAKVVTPFSMDLNGNAITVSNAVWALMKPEVPTGPDGKPVQPISAAALRPAIDAAHEMGRPFNMGMVFPVSTHNYELRYWLAAGGLNPGFYAKSDAKGQIGADVLLSVTPSPQMPATLEAGTIAGYSVGEPWNQAAVFKGIGRPVITDDQIFAHNPEKVFGLTEAFVEANPNTTLALTKALIRAVEWLDAGNGANRAEAVKILSRSAYVGADAEVIANSMTGTFAFGEDDVRPAPDFNIFFRDHASYPFYSDAVWTLTQMRRWGQIPEAKPDAWYDETAKAVYKPAIYEAAAKLLVAEGKADPKDFPFGTDGYKPPSAAFIDHIEYDGRFPNDYLAKFPIGLKGDQTVTNAGVQG